MKTKLFFLLSFLMGTACLLSQSKAHKNQNLIKHHQWLEITQGFQSPQNFFSTNKSALGLTASDELLLKSELSSKNGIKHYKFQQFHKGLEVFGAVYNLHEKNGKLVNGNGLLYPNIDVPTKVTISENRAVRAAKSHLAANHFQAEKVKNNFENLENIELGDLKLVIIDKSFPDMSGLYTVAYQFDLKFESVPPIIDRYFVDALDGSVINAFSQVCQHNVEGLAKTYYSGEQTISVDSIGPNEFKLRDLSRGNGIFTIDDYTGEVFEDTDNYWDNQNDHLDEIATDIHFGAISYYDYLNNTFNWQGLDNQGAELRSHAHIYRGAAYVNAYWDGHSANFGDGVCGYFDPLTTIDVVAHEFTHGLTDYTSDLIYSNESGALNESMSDIFGKATEYYFVPEHFSWEIGHSMRVEDRTFGIRSMSDPHKHEKPNFYQGEYWSSSGRVHTNSGVLNHWFYLLVEGKAGVNEIGESFDVNAIGFEKAMDIVFEIQSAYLMPSSNYAFAKQSSLEATKLLYGLNSMEYAAVEEAWKAVGVNNISYEEGLEIRVLQSDPSTCITGGPLELTLEIENLGPTILAGKTISYTGFLRQYSSSNNSEEQTFSNTLSQDFKTGDVLSYSLNFGLLEVDPGRNFMVYANVDYNGSEYEIQRPLSLFYAATDGLDLRLIAYNAFVDDCEPDMIEFEIYLDNDGCETLAEGTSIPLQIECLGRIENRMIILDEDMLPSDYVSHTALVNINPDDDLDITEATISINYPDDDVNTNNSEQISLLIRNQLTDVWLEDFSSFDFFFDEYLTIDVGFNYDRDIVYYQGERMLAFGAEDTLGIYEACDDLDRIFNSFDEDYDFSSAAICFYPTESAPRKLSFDVVQFRSQNAGIVWEEQLSSFVRVKFPSRTDMSDLMIHEQNEGEIVHHEIALPLDFQGEIEFEVFAALGQYNGLSQNSYEDGDYILLDNIQIDEVTSIDKSIEVDVLSVYPNPAKDVVNFKRQNASIKDHRIEIFNVLGQIIYTMPIHENAEWDVSQNISGVYYYKLLGEGSTLETGKIVVE